MPVSNSVIRRYTPPTCTLEVSAQSSALSKWMNRSVLKELRFELHFDDPRLPEEQRVTIQGDSDQLEALCAAVTNYVQEYLQQSPEDFWASFLTTTEGSSRASEDTQAQDFHNFSQHTSKFNSFNHQFSGIGIHLTPNNYLSHNLFLGTLANQTSGSVVKLNLLQLFDLATALDEYLADVLALPNLQRRSATFSLPTWAPVAAVLMLAVGLAPITWQYTNRVRQEQNTVEKPTSTADQIALEPSPTIQTPKPLPALTPPDSFPPLPQGSKLQVPSATLPPNIQTPQASPTSTLPTTSENALPSPMSPTGNSTLTIPGKITPEQKPLSSSENISPLAPSIKSESSLKPDSSQNNIALDSQSPNLSSRQLPLTSSIPSGNPSQPSPLSTLPSDSSITGSTTTTQEDLIARLREDRKAPAEVAARTSTGSDSSLFDTVQITEAREFLKKRWQPPSGLSQTLEYSLLVGVDGTIERIFPLGKAARDFVDRTGMPLIGEPFVSPNRKGQQVRIRAVLSPDGKVKTFPETE